MNMVQHIVNQLGDVALAGDHVDLAHLRGFELEQFVEQLVFTRLVFFEILQHHIRGLGRHHTAAFAFKQLYFQFRLEQLDLAADGRLFYVQ